MTGVCVFGTVVSSRWSESFTDIQHWVLSDVGESQRKLDQCLHSVNKDTLPMTVSHRAAVGESGHVAGTVWDKGLSQWDPECSCWGCTGQGVGCTLPSTERAQRKEDRAGRAREPIKEPGGGGGGGPQLQPWRPRGRLWPTGTAAQAGPGPKSPGAVYHPKGSCRNARVKGHPPSQSSVNRVCPGWRGRGQKMEGGLGVCTAWR